MEKEWVAEACSEQTYLDMQCVYVFSNYELENEWNAMDQSGDSDPTRTHLPHEFRRFTHCGTVTKLAASSNQSIITTL